MTEPDDRPGDREALRRAAELRAPLRRAAAVARSNGTGYAVFGGLTLAFSLLTSPLPPRAGSRATSCRCWSRWRAIACCR